jgi:predicted unusual protein kinase regulating ubiquinone biosynthesis (AarF/ABC1/UbiB family)
MNKLFVFGCSFTHGNGCLPNETYAAKYKKSEDDLIWPEIIAKKLNLKLYNFGMGGFGNDLIMDSMMENFDLITEGDVVIIQKTFSHRFDVCTKNQNNVDIWQTITPQSEHILKEKGYSKNEIISLLQTLSIIDSDLHNQRWIERFEFFKKIIEGKKVKKCILWDIEDGYHIKYEIIRDVDNMINDSHWSYKGHKMFAEEMLEKINN